MPRLNHRTILFAGLLLALAGASALIAGIDGATGKDKDVAPSAKRDREDCARPVRRRRRRLANQEVCPSRRSARKTRTRRERGRSRVLRLGGAGWLSAWTASPPRRGRPCGRRSKPRRAVSGPRSSGANSPPLNWPPGGPNKPSCWRVEVEALLDDSRKDRLAAIYQGFAERLLTGDPLQPRDPEGTYSLLRRRMNWPRATPDAPSCASP